MLITRKSMMSGITRTRDLDITKEQLDTYFDGALVQDAFPHLSDDDREFFLTGITPEEWDQMFSDEDQEVY